VRSVLAVLTLILLPTRVKQRYVSPIGRARPVMWPKVLLSSSINADGANSPELGAQTMFSDLHATSEGKEHRRKSPA